MAKIPQMTAGEEIRHMIDDGYTESYPRPYIGYSSLGGPCLREVWYNFRWCHVKRVSNRIQRLFQRGHHEENVIIADLESIGVTISKQQFEVEGLAKHVLGHIDGMLSNVPYFDDREILGEFKTFNDKYFKQIVKEKCKKAKPGYYAQAQSYMGKMGADVCLFIGTNKNDEKRHVEIIEFDKDAFNVLESKSYAVLESDSPLDKIGGPTWIACKFCESSGVCHHGQKVLKSCRSCMYGTIEDNGKWTCDGKKELSLDDQKAACDDYEILLSLIN